MADSYGVKQTFGVLPLINVAKEEHREAAKCNPALITEQASELRDGDHQGRSEPHSGVCDHICSESAVKTATTRGWHGMSLTTSQARVGQFLVLRMKETKQSPVMTVQCIYAEALAGCVARVH